MNTGLLPGTTVRDIAVQYRLTAAMSRSALSLRANPEAVLTLRSWTPAPGTGSCMSITDRDSGSVLASEVKSDPPGPEAVWEATVSVNAQEPDGERVLLVQSKSCDDQLPLTPLVAVSYVVDSRAPDVHSVHPVDDSNTVFPDQRITAVVEESGAGLDIGATRVEVTDVDSGVVHRHTGAGLAYDATTKVLSTTEAAVPGGIPAGRTLSVRIRVADAAGNVGAVSSAPDMGFTYVQLSPSAANVSIPPTSCAAVAQARSNTVSVTKEVVCRDVPVQFGTATVHVPTSRHGFAAGYLEHHASLTSAVFRSSTGETWPGGLSGQVTGALRYTIPSTEQLPATVTSEPRVVRLATVRGTVPGYWTDVKLEMGNVVPVKSNPDPRSNACPSLTFIAPGVECISDPMLNRVRVGSSGSDPIATRAARQLSGLAATLNVAHGETAYDIDIARRDVARLAAVGDVSSVLSLTSMEWEIYNAIRFRRLLHFADDTATVHGLLTGALPASPDTMFGVFSAAEMAELDLRNQGLGDDQKVVSAYVEQTASSVYGGMHLDHNNGTLVVSFVDGAGSVHEGPLRAQVANPARLVVRDVAHTEAELNTYAAEIGADVAALAAKGLEVRVLGVSVSENAVAADVCKGELPQASALDALRDEYPHIPLVHAAVPPSQIECDPPGVDLDYELIYDGAGAAGRHRDREAPPFLGGIAESYSKNGAFCTIGFAVVVDNNVGILTAKHCIKDARKQYVLTGGEAKHGELLMGSVDWISHDEAGYQSDAAMIDVDHTKASKRIYRHYTMRIPVKGKDTDSGGNPRVQGNLRCMSGIATGGHCGTITFVSTGFTSNKEYDEGAPFNGGQKRYEDLLQLNMGDCGGGKCRDAALGDSGAPTFWPRKESDGSRTAWATGLFYGLCTSGCTTSNVFVTKIEHNLQLRLGDAVSTATLWTE